MPGQPLLRRPHPDAADQINVLGELGAGELPLIPGCAPLPKAVDVGHWGGAEEGSLDTRPCQHVADEVWDGERGGG
jgi:hypothetical protein